MFAGRFALEFGREYQQWRNGVFRRKMYILYHGIYYQWPMFLNQISKPDYNFRVPLHKKSGRLEEAYRTVFGCAPGPI